MKKKFSRALLAYLCLFMAMGATGKDNDFEDAIRPYWINSWEYSIFRDQHKKPLSYDEKWNAYTRMDMTFYLCNTYYDKVGDLKKLNAVKKHANYFKSASVRAKVIKAKSEQRSLKKTLTLSPKLSANWNRDQTAFDKATQSCTTLSNNIRNGELQLANTIATEIKKTTNNPLNKQPPSESKQLNYPSVVDKLLEFNGSSDDSNKIINGINGADNHGNPIYSSNAMGKLYKKGYLGGYAMGVESYCPNIAKTFLASPGTKKGNGVWVEDNEDGHRTLKWNTMNQYHSSGLKDGWKTAQRYGCSAKVAHSIRAAETVASTQSVCFFGVCQ